MKRCARCNDFALYDDSILNCPLCSAALVEYKRNGGGSASKSVRPTAEAANDNNNGNNGGEAFSTSRIDIIPTFETRGRFRNKYRGVITEISSHTRYHSPFKKWINSVFRGEPYQFGHSTHETVIRLEEFTNNSLASKKRTLHYHGDVEGRFTYGDDVEVTAKRRGDRYIVTKMYLNDTESRVRPAGVQIPAWLVTLLTVIAVMLAASLISTVVNFFISGAFIEAVKAILRVLFLVLVGWFIIRSFFRRI